MNTNIHPQFRFIALIGALVLLLSLSCGAYGGKDSGTITSLAISPDGSLIAATFEKGSKSSIYVIPVKTGAAIRLTKNESGDESNPAFSSDGKRIIFNYWPQEHSQPQLLLANVDGSGVKTLPSGQFDELSPVLLPDNKTIIFSHSGYYGSYSPIAQPHPHGWRIYSRDLDGTNVRELTSESFYSMSPLSISPDGKHILLVAEGMDDGEHIAIYSLDQPGPPTLFLRPHVPKSDRIYECPNYLPDGEHILFMAPTGAFKFSYDVYQLDLTTGSLEKMTKKTGYATDFKVSADGKTGVFLKWHSDENRQIYLLNVPTHTLTPLNVSGMN